MLACSRPSAGWGRCRGDEQPEAPAVMGARDDGGAEPGATMVGYAGWGEERWVGCGGVRWRAWIHAPSSLGRAAPQRVRALAGARGPLLPRRWRASPRRPGDSAGGGARRRRRRLLELVVVVPRARPVALHVEAASKLRTPASRITPCRPRARVHAPRVHCSAGACACAAWSAWGGDARQVRRCSRPGLARREGRDEAARTESTGAGGRQPRRRWRIASRQRWLPARHSHAAEPPAARTRCTRAHLR